MGFIKTMNENELKKRIRTHNFIKEEFLFLDYEDNKYIISTYNERYYVLKLDILGNRSLIKMGLKYLCYVIGTVVKDAESSAESINISDYDQTSEFRIQTLIDKKEEVELEIERLLERELFYPFQLILLPNGKIQIELEDIEMIFDEEDFSLNWFKFEGDQRVFIMYIESIQKALYNNRERINKLILEYRRDLKF